MRRRAAACVLPLCVSLLAQARTAVAFDARDLLTVGRTEAETARDALPAPERLDALCHVLSGVVPRPNAGPTAFRLYHHADSGRLICIGQAEQVRVVQQALLRLRDEPPRLRLAITFARLPRAVAQAHGLASTKARAVDEIAAGEVLKAAVAHDGSLRNVPELVIGPLEWFAVREAAPAARRGVAESVLRGLCCPLDAQRVVIGCTLAIAHPGQVGEAPAAGSLESAVVMPGGGAMLLQADGDPAVVAWIRLVDALPPRVPPGAAPPQEPRAK